MTGSIRLQSRTFCQEHVVVQNRFSLMAVVSQDMFHCILVFSGRLVSVEAVYSPCSNRPLSTLPFTVFQLVRDNMKLLCKCHGVSGSCSAKICWRTMSLFREVGESLRQRFDGASHVRYSNKKRRLVPASRHMKKPSKTDLVYLRESPDFCKSDPALGWYGTHGRRCNRTSYGLEGCNLMCCGRGYSTVVETVEEDCNCKFFWCCRVVCDNCVTREERHYCK